MDLVKSSDGVKINTAFPGNLTYLSNHQKPLHFAWAIAFNRMDISN